MAEPQTEESTNPEVPNNKYLFCNVLFQSYYVLTCPVSFSLFFFLFFLFLFFFSLIQTKVEVKESEESKKTKLDDTESPERDTKKQRVQDAESVEKTSSETIGAASSSTTPVVTENEVTKTSENEVSSTTAEVSTETTLPVSVPVSVPVSTSSTKPTMEASLAAAMTLPSGNPLQSQLTTQNASSTSAALVATGANIGTNTSVSLHPTTPQGIALNMTPVSTNLVVPKTLFAVSSTSVTELQSSLASYGVVLTYNPTSLSQAPLMTHETIINIAGPFIYVHTAYVSLLQLSYSHITCVKLIVANDEASALIGQKGSSIRDIRLGLGGATNCIKVLERDQMNPNQRLVTLTGDMTLALKAHELIQDKIITFQNKDYVGVSTSLQNPGGAGGVGEISAQVQVPNESLGAVIGRAGSRIQEIRSLSAAKVTIDQTPVENSPYRLVSIVGSNESVEWAKYLITIAMSGGEPSQNLGNSIPPGMMATVKHQQQIGHSGVTSLMGQQQPQYSVLELQGAGYTPEQITAYMASQGQASQEQPGFYPMSGGMKLILSNETVGSIIGKSGCKINQMRSLSNARIMVLEPVIGSPVRTVTIESNDPFSIAKAQLLLTMAQAGVDVSAWQPGDLQNAMQQQQGIVSQPHMQAYGQQYGQQYGGQAQGGQYGAGQQYRGY